MVVRLGRRLCGLLALVLALAAVPCCADGTIRTGKTTSGRSAIGLGMPPSPVGFGSAREASGTQKEPTCGAPAWTISCLGDSVTRGVPYALTDEPYPACLQVLLDQSYGTGVFRVINHGIPGHRADQVLSDLQGLDWLAEDPDFVLLMVGANDLAQEADPINLSSVIDQTVTEVQSIVDLVVAHVNGDGSTPRIIVSAFIPNLVLDYWGTAAIALFNARLEATLVGMDRWTTSNWDSLYDSETGSARASLMSDTIHPNAQGYALLADNWLDDINALLPQVYYVSPSGQDGNPGSRNAPWRTIQHAADSVQAGDSVLVRAGTYSESVTFSVSGADGATITFAASPGEDVIVDGDLNLSQGVCYVDIGGFELRGYSVWGISLLGDNHHVSLSDLDIAGGEAGIHFTAGYSGEDPWYGPVSDVTVRNSTVHDCTYTAVDCTPGPCDRMTFRGLEIYGSGIGAGFGGDALAVERGQEIVVERCYLHDNGGDGIDLNSRDWDGNVEGIVARRNRVVQNHLTGIKLWAGGRIENNLVTGQGLLPVMLGAFPSTYEVLNNTIAYNMYDPTYSVRNYAFLVGYPNDETGISAPVTLTLANNIFAFNTGPSVGGPTGLYLGENVSLTEHNNLYWSREDGEIQAEFVSGHDPWFSRSEIGDGTWAGYTGQGQSDVSTSPLFVSGWPGVDLHLRAQSPAVDAGSTVGAPGLDLEGNPRPIGSGVDIGAYEYDPGIELEEGWNLVSLPRTPPDPAIEVVLASIAGNYDLVFAYDPGDAGNPWRRYCPSAPAYANDLTHVDETMGLWIRSTCADTLELPGFVPDSSEIVLRAGWNLVGYPELVPRSPSVALSGVSAEVIGMWAYAASDAQDPWKLYSPGAPVGVNDLDAMVPKSGYWVQVSSDCTWRLPSE